MFRSFKSSSAPVAFGTRRRQWRRALASAGILLLALASSPALGENPSCRVAGPVDTLNEVWRAVFACWTPPPGSAGMAITLTFSLRRNGTMIGEPRVTWSKLAGDQARQRAFVASVLKALAAALPLPLSDGMGGAIAGRPLALRFTAEAKAPELSL